MGLYTPISWREIRAPWKKQIERKKKKEPKKKLTPVDTSDSPFKKNPTRRTPHDSEPENLITLTPDDFALIKAFANNFTIIADNCGGKFNTKVREWEAGRAHLWTILREALKSGRIWVTGYQPLMDFAKKWQEECGFPPFKN